MADLIEATEAEWDALVAYVTDIQHRLRLDTWDVLIEHEPPEDNYGHDGSDTDAQAIIAAMGQNAKMRFHPAWIHQTPDLLRNTVVHELLHLPTDHVVSDLLDSIATLTSGREYALLKDHADKGYERMIDFLAGSIAPLLPLPIGVLRSDDGGSNGHERREG